MQYNKYSVYAIQIMVSSQPYTSITTTISSLVFIFPDFFFHLFHKYILSTYYVPYSVSGSGITSVDKGDNNPCLHRAGIMHMWPFDFYMNAIILFGNLFYLTLLYVMDSFPCQSTKNYLFSFYYDTFQAYQKDGVPHPLKWSHYMDAP